MSAKTVTKEPRFRLEKMLERRRNNEHCGECTAADGRKRFVFECDRPLGHKGPHRSISDGGPFDKLPPGTIMKEWR